MSSRRVHETLSKFQDDNLLGMPEMRGCSCQASAKVLSVPVPTKDERVWHDSVNAVFHHVRLRARRTPRNEKSVRSVWTLDSGRFRLQGNRKTQEKVGMVVRLPSVELYWWRDDNRDACNIHSQRAADTFAARTWRHPGRNVC